MVALTADSTPNAAFQVFTFPRCKLNGATKNDGQVGIVQSVPFVALLNNLLAGAGFDRDDDVDPGLDDLDGRFAGAWQ